MPRPKSKKAIAVKPLYYHGKGITAGETFMMFEADFKAWQSYGIVKEEKAIKKTKEQK
tara:strand:+ start:7025 stop:7198 length:174 start_codon:yes stop_codon:yes gene_type:complete